MLSKKLLGALGLATGLSVMSPQIALADKNENEGNKNVCTKIEFWDKIHFVFKDQQTCKGELFEPDTDLDIKVKDDPKEVVDLKSKIREFCESRILNDAIEIRNVTVTAVCTESKQVRENKGKWDD